MCAYYVRFLFLSLKILIKKIIQCFAVRRIFLYAWTATPIYQRPHSHKRPEMLKTFSFINFFEFVDTVYSRYSAVHTVCWCLKNKSIVKLEKVAILSFTYLFVFYYYLLTLFYYNYSYFFSFTFFKLPCEQRQHFRGISWHTPAHTAKM